MTAIERRGASRLTYVWLALCGLTALSAVAAAAFDDGHHNVTVGLVVLLIGAVKARLVLQEFMELRHAPRWLGRITDLWLTGVAAFVAIMHAFSCWPC
jgi:caa(3)-type oxidase subunit IV